MNSVGKRERFRDKMKGGRGTGSVGVGGMIRGCGGGERGDPKPTKKVQITLLKANTSTDAPQL